MRNIKLTFPSDIQLTFARMYYVIFSAFIYPKKVKQRREYYFLTFFLFSRTLALSLSLSLSLSPSPSLYYVSSVLLF